MRDIRDDLNERLSAAREEHSELAEQIRSAQAKQAVVAKKIQAYLDVLQVEDATAVAPVKAQPAEDMTEFLLTLLNGNPLDKDAIRSAAEANGTFNEVGSLGRSLHATLYNLERTNRISRLKDGRYVADLPGLRAMAGSLFASS